jgi:acetyl-CoA carboxylase carboxyl transferase subunit alpha
MRNKELLERLAELKSLAAETRPDLGPEIDALAAKIEGRPAPAGQAPERALKAMDRVRLARLVGRPTTLDYIERICDEFMELKGDRAFGDDPAMIGGIGTIDGKAFTIIGHQRGRNMKEAIKRRNGMAGPEGYRKALRLARQAERFGRPILSLIDTQGAYPGISSEERGIGEAIARNLRELSIVAAPMICVVIGEGGSGGALGIGVGDEVWMLENSIYSVISPEGCASILLRDSSKAEEAAEMMRLTAKDLFALGVIDGILEEPEGGAQKDPERVARIMKSRVLESAERLSQLSPKELLARRFAKYSEMGSYSGRDDRSAGFLKRFLFSQRA